jgi:hypothetical protein
MSLLDWAKRKAVQHEASKYDTPEEATAAVAPYVKEWSMSPKIEAALTAALGAALAGAAQALTMHADPLSPAGFKAAATAAIVGALIALAALFRQPPIAADKIGNALVVKVAEAAEAGHLEPKHVEALKIAAEMQAIMEEDR